MNLSYDITAREAAVPKTAALSLLQKLALVATFTVLMAISANSFIYLPFTPVPLTLQVLTVLGSGILLGSRLAFYSQLSYLMLGIAGFPVFAGFKSGIPALLGPTGGFILSFMLAAVLSGFLYERTAEQTFSKNAACFLSCILGLSVIYFSGFAYLYGFLYASLHISHAVQVLDMAVRPFLLMDLLKILAIVWIVNTEKTWKR